jgi:RNAse (barnase) inhibitor barstar
MQNGCITLFYRLETLDEYVNELKELKYGIVQFDCTNWKNINDMFEQIADKLDFPDYFGMNFNALNDCLSDLEIPEESGKVLVFKRFGTFAKRDYDIAWSLLDYIANNSRLFLLFGQRLLALVQSDDDKIRFDKIGSTNAIWNGAEWLDKNRGL